MNLTKSLFVFIALTLFIYSCSKDNGDDEVNTNTPGNFSLSRVGTVKKVSLKSAQTKSSGVFNFGDIKASKEYYFLLSNSGDEPIFDIKLNMDNSSFSINPLSIDYLSGGMVIKEESKGIIPMLTLGITHGINLNGVGFSDLLPMGENNSTLEINGKTIDGGDTIEISSYFDFSVYARVMDITLFENNSRINLESPRGAGAMSSNPGGLGFVRYYSVYDTSSISVKNTGNVPIDLYYGDPDSQTEMITLNQSDSSIINLSAFINVLVFDSKGTITDNSRIQLGDDGKGYIAIIKDKHQ